MTFSIEDAPARLVLDIVKEISHYDYTIKDEKVVFRRGVWDMIE
jgi:hypothetical protein